jgi:lipoprotein Spr/probable lipoprotein NlpC
VIIFLSACSSKKTRIYNKKQSSTLQKKVKQTASKNSNYKTKALYEEYNKWLGTKYKLGGQSLSGVDCSSFIQQVYLNVFGLKIPRTTKKQAKSGYEIVKKELHAGDMIFFKTGWDVRHVGIIIENGKFIHTSTKRGVSMSSIHNPYWRGNYWQSRRVLP